MKTISLSDVMKKMQNGTFDIAVCEFDKKKKTGGKRTVYKNASLLDSSRAAAKARDKRLKRSGDYEAPETKIALRNPHHRVNCTRNIRTAGGDVRTIHKYLIEEFNGKRVIV